MKLREEKRVKERKRGQSSREFINSLPEQRLNVHIIIRIRIRIRLYPQAPVPALQIPH